MTTARLRGTVTTLKGQGGHAGINDRPIRFTINSLMGVHQFTPIKAKTQE